MFVKLTGKMSKYCLLNCYVGETRDRTVEDSNMVFVTRSQNFGARHKMLLEGSLKVFQVCEKTSPEFTSS